MTNTNPLDAGSIPVGIDVLVLSAPCYRTVTNWWISDERS